MQLGVRQSDGRPLREHLLSAQRGDGYTHPLLQDDPLPPGGHELFNLVIELGESRPQGMGPAGAIPPQLGEAAFSTAADGADADSLALAHRRALWQLAQRIAATP